MRNIILALAALVSLVATPALASTITVSPTTVSVTKGQTFTVNVAADGGGTKLYTVKAAISFPATLLEVSSFAFANAWVPLTMSGYDLTDNTAGSLVKTAGFPGGVAGVQSFGTVTFKAKETGTGTISVTSQSLAYDAQSKNTLTGTQGSSAVTVASQPTPAPKPAATEQPAPKPVATTATTGTKPAPEVTEEATTTDAQLAAAAQTGESQVASAGFMGVSRTMWLVLLAIVLLAIGGGVWRRFGRAR